MRRLLTLVARRSRSCSHTLHLRTSLELPRILSSATLLSSRRHATLSPLNSTHRHSLSTAVRAKAFVSQSQCKRLFSNRIDNELLLSRLRQGVITKSEVTQLIVDNESMRQTSETGASGSSVAVAGSSTAAGNTSYSVAGAGTSVSIPLAIGTAAAGNGGGMLGGLRNLGSKANPVYMRKQTSFKELIFSLFPFFFIFWLLGGFDAIKNRKTGGVGGGMFGKNFTEWDDDDWEDDDDFDDDEEDDGTVIFEDDEMDLELNEEDGDDILRTAARKRLAAKREKRRKKAGILKSDGDKADGDSQLSAREKWWRRLGIRVSNDEDSDTKKKESDSPTALTLGGNEDGSKDKKKRRKQKRVRFRDVCGAEEAKADLQDLVDYLGNPSKYQRMGCKLPKGVLMSGPPGNGKTLLARALAGEAGVPFLATNGASFDEIFVGVGVMRVRKLFERAKEKAPCIVFIDEIDAIANTRMQMGTAHSSDSLNALLSEMDGFEQNTGIMVIAATNMPEKLDPALVRPGRFDRKVHISAPDKAARVQIVRKYLDERHSQDVDVELLVGDVAGFSAAELESMVNLASIETVKAGGDCISMEMLIEAKEIISMGRARRSMQVSAAVQRVTAFHESGHAVVSLYTKGSKPIYKATILPRGQALGFVASVNDDEYMSTKEALLAQLDTCMGGRAAEELFSGSTQITTGASSDFSQATRVATAMVCQYGMSKRIGKVFYKFEDIPSLSPSLRNAINAEVKRLLDESYQRAKELISDHSEDMRLLAQALLEKETLSAEQIKDIIGFDDSKVREPTDSCAESAQPLSIGFHLPRAVAEPSAAKAQLLLEAQMQHSGLLLPNADNLQSLV